MSNDEIQTKRCTADRLLWPTYALLVAIGIPWYWPADSLTLWFGVPAWFVTAMVCSVGVSLLTAMAFGRRWPDEEDAE